MPARETEKEIKAYLVPGRMARPQIESRGFYGREMSARERQDACRRFEQNIGDYEDEIGFLRVGQREIDAQIASTENALAAMKAPLVRLKARELRKAATGESVHLSPLERKNLFRALFEGLPPQERLARARPLVEALPEGHPFRLNPHLSDHRASDAGFYDLLLHGQDRAYDVSALCGTLDQAGWRLLSFATPALYDLARIAPVPEGMNPVAAMAVAEKLRGTLRLHAGYAVAADDTRGPARHTNQALVPHLRGVAPRARNRVRFIRI